jgi:type II secretory pathway pseudopilin PulG
MTTILCSWNLQPAPRRIQSARAAFTLFEMILVLAVVIILSAAVYPSLEGMYCDSKVTAAGDMVRGAWAEGQAHAMNEGRPYRFAVSYGTGDFRLAPDTADLWAGAGDSAPAYDPANPMLVLKSSMPKGVRFAAGDPPPGNPSDQNNPPVAQQQAPDSGAWSRVVTFLPDGSAREDASIVINARGARPLEVRIRGLTGVIRAKTVEDKRP